MRKERALPFWLMIAGFLLGNTMLVSAQHNLPYPLEYKKDVITDFGFGLDATPTILPGKNMLFSISALGKGMYYSKYLGKTDNGSILYDRPVQLKRCTDFYSSSKLIYVEGGSPDFFAALSKNKQWAHFDLDEKDSLNMLNPIMVTAGGKPITGDFTIVKNRDGIFLLKPSVVGGTYWPGNQNPWVYPANQLIGFNKGYDKNGNWLGEKTVTHVIYAELIDKKKWAFGNFKKVKMNGEVFSMTAYSSPIILSTVNVLNKKEKQVLISWDVDNLSVFETGLVKGEFTFYPRKLPLEMEKRTRDIYFGSGITSTEPLYGKDKGFVQGGNPGILIEHYFDNKRWNQRPVKMKGGFLHVQTLSVPNWSDWDDDGVSDIVAGDASGYIWFFKNAGTEAQPAWQPGVKLKSGNKTIHHQAGYSGSIQGPNERRWGYTQPFVFDWDGDGLSDIVCNDITGNYVVYKNIGERTKPVLSETVPIIFKGEPFKAAWRSKPSYLPKLFSGDKDATKAEPLLAINSEGFVCMYPRNKKDPNVLLEEIGLLNKEGKPLRIVGFAGHEGRATLAVCDFNKDGVWDIMFGQGIHMFQSKEVPSAKPYATPYVMINKGTNQNPEFDQPMAICQSGGAPIKMDVHGCWISLILDKNYYVKKFLAGAENGMFYMFSNIQLCK